MQQIWRGVRGKSYLGYYAVGFEELSHLFWRTRHSCFVLHPVAINSALWQIEGTASCATRELLGLYHRRGALLELSESVPVCVVVNMKIVAGALDALLSRMRSDMGTPDDVQLSLSAPLILPERRNYNSGSSLRIVLAK